MTIPTLSESDLSRLTATFPDLDFTDQQRREVLLEAGSRDVQAAPGSGKTTLLAAKLQLLSEKWPHATRGICVLSHTNVAGREIATRLGATSTGGRLLGYPHFLGTIHGFVNQYLATPLLRSEGIPIEVIDNDLFALRAIRRLETKRTLCAWVRRNENRGPQAIATLRYEGAELKLGWAEGHLPGEGTPSHREAKQLKDSLTASGIFRHDDMFAFAECLLRLFPAFRARVSHRFPLVLIDEMQDTSWAQEDMLSRLFDASVVVQRFGDRNQRILNSPEDTAKLTFPRPGHLSVTTTKRFPESIAAVVRTVQEHGEPLLATVQPDSPPPMLLLYDSKQVAHVIEAFGQYLLDQFSDEELRRGAVKAICARKQGSAKVPPGRHLGDYWPAYEPGSIALAGDERVFRLLRPTPGMLSETLSLQQRVRDVRRALWLILRAGGCIHVIQVRSPDALLREFTLAGIDCGAIRSLIRQLTLGLDPTATEQTWTLAIDSMHAALSPLLPAGVSRAAFGALEIFETPVETTAGATSSHEVIASQGNRALAVHIGTIASVKGETHLATLVMEAYAGRAKNFDLQEALPYIAGAQSLSPGASETRLASYRNLYVATSRPSRLLGLAINRDHTKQEHLQMLADKGWAILTLDPATKRFIAVDPEGVTH